MLGGMDQQVIPPLVVIVDDDAAVRSALAIIADLDGYRVETCASGEALLQLDLPPTSACLVIDERLSGLSGLRALGQLRRRGCNLPAVLITSHPSRQLRWTAARAGAPILEKPLLGDGLLNWIRQAAPK
jgi:FixJ family two-component response regulator